MPFFIIFLIIAIAVLAFFFSTYYIVPQGSVAIVERLGKYHKTSTAGLHFCLPLGIDKVVMAIATQYRVSENNVTDAFYKLLRPKAQIQSYIEDALRNAVPKLTLDELFEKKDEIALEVQKQVAEEMSTYGYIIVKTLITRVEPDAEVKQSMNEINAAQRKRMAAQELAEADKIKIVTAAEAEAEKDRLHGVGIANQRKAIVDGLAESVKELKDSNMQLTEESIMSILLVNQYLDSLNNFAKGNNSTIFLPSNPTGIEDIRTQMLSALATDKNK